MAKPIRPDVEEFARVMSDVLNFHQVTKGDSWKELDIEFLEAKLMAEWAEYQEDGRNPEELVDIANVCMMLYHRKVLMLKYTCTEGRTRGCKHADPDTAECKCPQRTPGASPKHCGTFGTECRGMG